MQEKSLDRTAMKGVNGRVIARSFFLEALWNHKKMQNIGFVFCICPALRRLYPDKAELASALARHLEPVNTHPLMGPLLVGLTARLESELDPSAVMAYRNRVMSALAANGDHIFWSRVKPLSAIWGAMASLALFGTVAGCASLLMLYNVPGMAMRCRGFARGWNHGLGELRTLKSPFVERAMSGLRSVAIAGMGLSAGLCMSGAVQSGGSGGVVLSGVAVGFFFVLLAAVAFLLLHRNASLTALVYLLTVVAVLTLVFMNAGTRLI